jgi:2-polyprenyl-6-methoxyphenol hydroxylase-like FAD-dependent oxidoreductase
MCAAMRRQRLAILQAVGTAPVEFPQTIKTSQLHGPKTILIGDAAHCVTPILGQGANAALEDARVLADIIATPLPGQQLSPSLSDVPKAFTKSRLADARALVDLNRFVLFATSFGPFTPLVLLPVFLHVAFRLVLSLLPFVPRPELLQMANGGSYHKMKKAFVTDVILACAILFAAATRALATFLPRLLGPAA